ncbi:hypothetical protein KIPB_009495, partial [Kipferlia bialata]
DMRLGIFTSAPMDVPTLQLVRVVCDCAPRTQMEWSPTDEHMLVTVSDTLTLYHIHMLSLSLPPCLSRSLSLHPFTIVTVSDTLTVYHVHMLSAPSVHTLSLSGVKRPEKRQVRGRGALRNEATLQFTDGPEKEAESYVVGFLGNGSACVVVSSVKRGKKSGSGAVTAQLVDPGSEDSPPAFLSCVTPVDAQAVRKV